MKKEVKVEVEEGNILQIRGERGTEKEEKNDMQHCMEGVSAERGETFMILIKVADLNRRNAPRLHIWFYGLWLYVFMGIYVVV